MPNNVRRAKVSFDDAEEREVEIPKWNGWGNNYVMGTVKSLPNRLTIQCMLHKFILAFWYFNFSSLVVYLFFHIKLPYILVYKLNFLDVKMGSKNRPRLIFGRT